MRYLEECSSLPRSLRSTVLSVSVAAVILSCVVPLLACDYEEGGRGEPVSRCPSLYGPLEELTRESL